ncbi:hypothetical protein [Nonomuraea sp. NPDC049480]|uniref:hypothetical protein n=1 Tax=Nonomuraea sp. NPDC049480 TaxID=3364353 RepID=UPI0037B3F1E6
MRGHKRQRADNGQRNQETPPVTIETLPAMVGVCDLATARGLRDRVLLAAGLALMGRRPELAALTLDDVCEAGDGLEVTIRTSKTDKESRGEVVAIPRGSHPLTDPVEVWRSWVDFLA